MLAYSRMEDINGINGCLSRLFESIDKIDPCCHVLSDILRLEGLAHDESKESRVTSTPLRKDNIPYACVILTNSKIKTFDKNIKNDFFKWTDQSKLLVLMVHGSFYN